MHRYLRAALVVFLSVSLASLLTFSIVPIVIHSRDLFLICAVIVTARIAGAVPGLIAAFLSVFVFDWFFDQTPHVLDFTLGGVIRAAVFSAVSILVAGLEQQRRRAIAHLESSNRALSHALEEVKTLRGILPICAHCKKIRNDAGIWVQVERYVHDHSQANFTHTICPACFQILYPDFQLQKSGPDP